MYVVTYLQFCLYTLKLNRMHIHHHHLLHIHLPTHTTYNIQCSTMCTMCTIVPLVKAAKKWKKK